MSSFEVVADCDLTALQAWDAVTHWPAHGRHVPLTRVEVTQDAGGLGDVFVGRTGLGRLAFDDPMRVTFWQPPTPDGPGRCVITKLGRVVGGHASIEVRAVGDSSQVRWTEEVEIGPRWLQRLGAPLVSRAGALVFGRTLRRLLADAEHAPPGG